MKKMAISSLIFTAILFCSYNFTVLSETREFNTVTEALNYNGDRDAVIKLVITGTITGTDYSPSSDWSKFRTFNETFPNLEAVEILTNQDIPDGVLDWFSFTFKSLFGYIDYSDFSTDDTVGVVWLKSFSAPNVKKIGNSAFLCCPELASVDFPSATVIGVEAFSFCKNLTTVSFPNVTTIMEDAFRACENLTIADFPLATTIGDGSFDWCYNLESVSFGTGFTTPTTIFFDADVWGGVFGFAEGSGTENIDLILGENVLPAPDLEAMTWQSDGNTTPYTWKSIEVKTVSVAEMIKNATVSIFPNPTTSDFTVSFELEKPCNMKIVLSDISGQELVQIYDGFSTVGLFTKTVNTENLAKGIYFLKVLIDGKYTVEKIVVN